MDGTCTELLLHVAISTGIALETSFATVLGHIYLQSKEPTNFVNLSLVAQWTYFYFNTVLKCKCRRMHT